MPKWRLGGGNIICLYERALTKIFLVFPKKKVQVLAIVFVSGCDAIKENFIEKNMGVYGNEKRYKRNKNRSD